MPLLVHILRQQHFPYHRRPTTHPTNLLRDTGLPRINYIIVDVWKTIPRCRKVNHGSTNQCAELLLFCPLIGWTVIYFAAIFPTPFPGCWHNMRQFLAICSVAKNQQSNIFSRFMGYDSSFLFSPPWYIVEPKLFIYFDSSLGVFSPTFQSFL